MSKTVHQTLQQPNASLSVFLSSAIPITVRPFLLLPTPSLPSFLGDFYDFTSDLASADTAYTSLALSAHTDTTYFTDPAGLQLFHLLSHTEGFGGASLLVDGFRAAEILKHEEPYAYSILSTHRVPTHASGNEGISIRPTYPFPVLNFAPETGELIQVRWNNDDRARIDPRMAEAWYFAARKWVEILRRKESEYWEQLKPGKPLSKWSLIKKRGIGTNTTM